MACWYFNFPNNTVRIVHKYIIVSQFEVSNHKCSLEFKDEEKEMVVIMTSSLPFLSSLVSLVPYRLILPVA